MVIFSILTNGQIHKETAEILRQHNKERRDKDVRNTLPFFTS